TRPLRLTVLCIMTFIFSGLGAISSLLTPFLSDVMVSFIKSSPNYVEADYAENLKVIQAGWAYHLPTFIFAIGSLTGAILMWKLKKAGFHFYAFSNLALLFIPTLVLHLTIGWSAIFVTIGFIGMYGLNLRSMK
ncbi:MAG: hypothetical protein ACXVED_16540, partial [Bacteroidia bacterium]